MIIRKISLLPLVFFLLTLSSIPAIGFVGLLLLIVMFIYGSEFRFKKYYLIAFLPLIYWLINLAYRDSIDQLLYVDFFRYDGKLIVVWSIFLMMLFLPIRSVNEKTFFEFIKKIVYFCGLVLVANLIYPFFTSHNAVAGFAGGAIISSIFIKYYTNFKLKFYDYLFLVFITIIFFVFVSRAFTLALGVSIVLLIFLSKKINYSNKVLIMSTLSLIFIVSIVYSGLYERFIFSLSGEDFNVNTRFLLWDLAYTNWTSNLDSIFFGIGIGNFNDISIDQIYMEQHGIDLALNEGRYFGEKHTHNIVLQILTEQGIIGLFFYFSTVLFFIQKIRIRSVKLLNYILFIYLFIASMFGLNFFTPSTALIFYFILSVSNKVEEYV